MSVENHSVFTIEYKTQADLAGAKAQLAILQGQRDALDAMGKSTKAVEAQIEKLQHSINQSELFGMGEQAKEAGEKFKLLGHGTHEAHATFHALNELFPGLAQFARFLTSGFTAAVGAALIAFEYLKDKIDEFSKIIDELNTGPGARGEWAEKMEDNMRSAGTEAAAFEEHIRQITTAQQTLQQVTDELIRRIKAQSEAQNQVAEAERQLESLRVELLEKLGKISPEKAIKIRLDLDDEAFREKLRAEVAAIQAELQARLGQQQKNKNSLPGLAGVMDDADAKALDAKNAADKNQSKIDQDKSNLEAYKAKAEANDEKLQELYGSLQTTGVQIEEKLREQKGVQLQSLIGGTQSSLNQEKAKQGALDSAAAVAKAQAEKAKADYEAAAKSASDIKATVEKLQADLAAATAKNASLEQAHEQQTQIKKQEADIDLAQKVQSGAATPQEQQEYKDQQTQKTERRLPGAEAANDAATAIASARVIEAGMRGQRPKDRDPGQMAELHELLQKIIGLQENQTHEIDTQRTDLAVERRRISDLESIYANSRAY